MSGCPDCFRVAVVGSVWTLDQIRGGCLLKEIVLSKNIINAIYFLNMTSAGLLLKVASERMKCSGFAYIHAHIMLCSNDNCALAVCLLALDASYCPMGDLSCTALPSYSQGHNPSSMTCYVIRIDIHGGGVQIQRVQYESCKGECMECLIWLLWCLPLSRLCTAVRVWWKVRGVNQWSSRPRQGSEIGSVTNYV